MLSQYKESATPQENIRLPDSLLSRYDLLFIVLDRGDEKTDRLISQHVTNMHRQTLHESDKWIFDENEEIRETLESTLFQTIGVVECLSTRFIKKYIHYAKIRIKPILTIEAAESIRRMYNELRVKREEIDVTEERTLPVTLRTLETLIRLSTAHA